MTKRFISICVASTTVAILMTCASRSDTIEPTGVAALGSSSAPIVLVFFTDYRCAACRSFGSSIVPSLRPFIDAGRLRVVVAEIGTTSESRRIARAARCAREFGKYWSFLEMLAENPTQVMADVATRAGVPADPFSRCIASDRYSLAIIRATEFANANGVDSAPEFFLGSASHPTRRTLKSQALSTRVIDSLVRRELADCQC
jgi:protein-disulfide isomerase